MLPINIFHSLPASPLSFHLASESGVHTLTPPRLPVASGAIAPLGPVPSVPVNQTVVVTATIRVNQPASIELRDAKVSQCTPPLLPALG